MTLKSDPEFRDLIPSATKDERKQLDDMLAAGGVCNEAVVVWNGTIIEGYPVYERCRRLSIPYRVIEKSFTSRKDAMIWVINNQLARRNLHPAAKIDLAHVLVNLLAKKAKENQSIGGRTKAPIDEDDKVNVRKEVAKVAKVSETNVFKYMKVLGSNDPKLIANVKSGDMKIGTAYNKFLEQRKTVTVLDSSTFTGQNGPTHCAKALDSIKKQRKLYNFISETLDKYGVSGTGGAGCIKKALEAHLSEIMWLMNEGDMKMKPAAAEAA